MFDDPDDTGDIDRNGVPDSIQRDPVMMPIEEPMDRSNVARLMTTIDDITFAIQRERLDADGTPGGEPTPGPDAPTPPPADADDAALGDYQRDLGRYNRMFEL